MNRYLEKNLESICPVSTQKKFSHGTFRTSLSGNATDENTLDDFLLT